MNEPHKHRSEIIAWANGAVIQQQCKNDIWVVTNEPSWEPYIKYRVKPKVLKYRVALFYDELSQQHWLRVEDDLMVGLEAIPFFKRWVSDWIEVEIEEQGEK